jgi:nucleoside recognition membrane protein YjiH
MNENPYPATRPQNIWMRGLFMLLMSIAYQLTGTLVCFVAVVQFIMVLLTGTPNVYLLAFGRSLARYLHQVVDFLTFAAEAMPFPFSEWPSDD